MNARRRTVLIATLALGGIALAALITWGTSQLVSQRIGLASEPLTAGQRLLPAALAPAAPAGPRQGSPTTAPRSEPTTRGETTTPAVTTTPATTAPGRAPEQPQAAREAEQPQTAPEGRAGERSSGGERERSDSSARRDD